MANMSYCRFQNTEKDLSDCGEALEEDGIYNLRGDELRSAIRLIQLCRDIAEQFENIDLEKIRESEHPRPNRRM